MTGAEQPPDPATAAAPMLAGAALLVGAWALLPPYSGPALNTAARVEFVDHVVPAIVVAGAGLVALVVARRRATRQIPFGAGLAVFLAGFWMTATHVPLVLQATRDQAPVDATAYHSVPGLAVLALGLGWCWLTRPPPP